MHCHIAQIDRHLLLAGLAGRHDIDIRYFGNGTHHIDQFRLLELQFLDTEVLAVAPLIAARLAA
jgi:hypothetical protein